MEGAILQLFGEWGPLDRSHRCSDARTSFGAGTPPTSCAVIHSSCTASSISSRRNLCDEATSMQVKVVFLNALEAGDLPMISTGAPTSQAIHLSVDAYSMKRIWRKAIVTLLLTTGCATSGPTIWAGPGSQTAGELDTSTTDPSTTDPTATTRTTDSSADLPRLHNRDATATRRSSRPRPDLRFRLRRSQTGQSERHHF
jgi:hypothetical protein